MGERENNNKITSKVSFLSLLFLDLTHASESELKISKNKMPISVSPFRKQFFTEIRFSNIEVKEIQYYYFFLSRVKTCYKSFFQLFYYYLLQQTRHLAAQLNQCKTTHVRQCILLVLLALKVQMLMQWCAVARGAV